MINFAAPGRHCWRGLIVVFVLASESLAGLSFDFRYIDDSTGTFASRGWLDSNSLFQRNIAAAASLWGAHFASDETIIIRVDPMSFAARAGGTFTLGRSLYMNPQGQKVWEAGPLTRILTGNNPGEEDFGYDILLGFDAPYVENNYWFDPQPELRIAPVPSNKGDFLSVALHELGHGFGMAGFRDFPTGELNGANITQMDELSYFGGNGDPIGPGGQRNAMYFDGETAARLFGRDLPLTHKPPGHPLHSQNYYHLSACDSGAPDGLQGTLMNGCAVPHGERLHISPFDLAVYADMGYPMANLFGDFNNDGDVDAADYVVWRKLLGTAYTTAYYNIWRSSFGSTTARGVPVASALPELPTCTLLLLAAIFSFAHCRRICSKST
ncbi:MAG TPA: hypothetical protein VGK58_08375 [Lacipirellulaceae bacterium]